MNQDEEEALITAAKALSRITRPKIEWRDGCETFDRPCFVGIKFTRIKIADIPSLCCQRLFGLLSSQSVPRGRQFCIHHYS